jgi:hypothetical protein
MEQEELLRNLGVVEFRRKKGKNRQSRRLNVVTSLRDASFFDF